MTRPGYLETGYCLYYGDDPEAARAYVRNHKLTAEDVRIVRRDDDVLVLTKRELKWP